MIKKNQYLFKYLKNIFIRNFFFHPNEKSDKNEKRSIKYYNIFNF